MCASDAKSQPALGFLTVLEHEALGLTGGYLVLNMAARPLEFHCTAPLKASRAQQILFGPTLEAYLYGEQIGQALLAKAAVQPLVVCTDVAPALSLRPYIGQPVLLVMAESVELSASAAGRAVPLACVTFEIGRNRVALAADQPRDRAVVEQLEALQAFDLLEPFERIRQAVEEAHKSGRAA